MASNHLLRSVEKDWTDVYQPIYQELQRLSRIPDKGPKSLDSMSSFPGSRVTSVEDNGRLLPRKFRDLKKDLTRLRNLGQKAVALSRELDLSLDVETHMKIEDMRDQDGAVRDLLQGDLEYFVRCGIDDALSQENEHALRSLPFRTARNSPIQVNVDSLRDTVESIASYVKQLHQKDLASRNDAIDSFYAGAEKVKANLEKSLRTRGFKRYKSAFKTQAV